MREFSEGTNGTGGFIHFFAVSIVVLGTFWFFVFYDIVIMLRFVTQMWTFDHFTRLRPAAPLGLVASSIRLDPPSLQVQASNATIPPTFSSAGHRRHHKFDPLTFFGLRRRNVSGRRRLHA